MKSVIIFAFAFAVFLAVTSAAPSPHQAKNFAKFALPLLRNRGRSALRGTRPVALPASIANTKNIFSVDVIKQAIESTRMLTFSAAQFANILGEITDMDTEIGGRAGDFFEGLVDEVVMPIGWAYTDTVWQGQTPQEIPDNVAKKVEEIESSAKHYFQSFMEDDFSFEELYMILYYLQNVLVHFEGSTNAIADLWAVIHPGSVHKIHHVKTTITNLKEKAQILLENRNAAKGLIDEMHEQSIETLVGTTEALVTFVHDFIETSDYFWDMYERFDYFDGCQQFGYLMFELYRIYFSTYTNAYYEDNDNFQHIVDQAMTEYEATWKEIGRRIADGEMNIFVQIIFQHFTVLVGKYFYDYTAAMEPWVNKLRSQYTL